LVLVTLNDQQRETAAAHLNYEIQMMATLHAWTAKLDEEGPPVLRNACLEATLLHARLMIEFLAGRPRDNGRGWNRNDITPRDFVSGWAPKELHHLDGYLELADKHVVHLSLDRATATESRTWALGRMVDAILTEFGNFADAAEREHSLFAAGFRGALTHAMMYRDFPVEAWPPTERQ
jgi:hypothetical protein